MAHGIKPLIHVGRRGLTDELLEELSRTLDSHELVKIRFSDFKDDKKELCAVIEERLSAENVGIIGHNAIFYRQQEDPEKRKIVV